MDGALGAGTAVMFEAFSDDPGNTGKYAAEAIPLSKIEERIAGADAAGLQVEVHAIGDKAIVELLDIYARVAKKNGPKDRRFRIEHAQHLRARTRSRASPSRSVIASMQPYHAVDDGRWADRRLGPERAASARTRSAGSSTPKATVAFGSDWDVAPLSPILGIAAAVTRATIDGKQPGGWVPEQKITAEEALRAYTVTAAYAAFEEKEKGSLEIGKLADFVILSDDVLSVAPRGDREDPDRPDGRRRPRRLSALSASPLARRSSGSRAGRRSLRPRARNDPRLRPLREGRRLRRRRHRGPAAPAARVRDDTVGSAATRRSRT